MLVVAAPLVAEVESKLKLGAETADAVTVDAPGRARRPSAGYMPQARRVADSCCQPFPFSSNTSGWRSMAVA